jgi:FkbM family methyltransferase
MSQFELQKWQMANNDNTLALDFPGLKDTGVVIDTSGVSGDWANAIYKKYGCTVYIFEPARRYFAGLKKRFDGIDKIVLKKAMLSNRTEKGEMFLKEEASSSHQEVSQIKEEIDLLDISEFRRIEQLGVIDVLRLNVNGEEYNIFERMFEKMIHKKIKYIMVQFTPYIEDAFEKRDSIRKRLKKTHNEIYNYEFVWELWKLKE